MNIKSIPSFRRPREKLGEYGVENLSDRELMALILRTGNMVSGVMQTAETVLKKYSLKDLSQITVRDLTFIKGVGDAQASSIIAAAELGKRMYNMYPRPLNHPEDILPIVADLRTKQREHLTGLYLNSRNHLMFRITISVGTVDASLAHPREVFAPAIRKGASGIILVHNHPSGDPEASQADIDMTARMIESGKILGIEILDHIIVARNKWSSLNRTE